VIDIDRLAEAAAKMRRPELRLNPADMERMTAALRPPSILGHDPEWVPGGIAIVADEAVEPGHMWLRDAAPEPLTFILPEPIEPDVLAARDRLRNRWTTIGMDLGYSPSIATIATFEDGRCVDVRHFRRPRCPWKFTGRKATRVRWRRTGRR
jgi:hypothetical protein